MMTSEPPLVSIDGRYTVTQVAAKYKVHRSTVRRWLDAGMLRCEYRSDGRCLVSGSELMRFWKENVI